MIEWIAFNIAPIMFISLIAMLLIGYPVAFTLAANGVLFFVIGVELAKYAPGQINLSWPLLGALPDRVFGIMNNDTLLAIPFFTFMGLILERSRMAEDLLDTVGQMFGPVRGGLAYAAILVGALLAATTGVVAASVIAMGLISLPIMMRYGYSRSLATGTIMASGTLAQIVPPSLVLIVMADQLGRSVGDMYAGAIIPGLMLTGLYCIYVFVVTLVNPKMAPPLPPEARIFNGGFKSLIVMTVLTTAIAYGATWYFGNRQGAGIWGFAIAVTFAYAVALANKHLKLGMLSVMTEQVIMVLIPPLALIFLVLGTIFLGVATPTEGGAMGAAGALLLAAMKGRLNFTTTRQALESTAKLSAFVMFILIGARVFALTFYGVNGHLWVKSLMLDIPGGMYGFLIFINVLFFVLGMFLDFFEIAFIALPLLVPVAEAIFKTAPEAVEIAKQLELGVIVQNGKEVIADVGPFMIWFGVLLGMNLQTSFLTPPFGFALFYLRSVAPTEPYLDKPTGQTIAPITTGNIYSGAVNFILLQLIGVLLVAMFPNMVMHYADKKPYVDPSTIRIEIPQMGIPGGSPFGAPPGLGAPPGGFGLPPPPAFGAPPPVITPSVPGQGSELKQNAPGPGTTQQPGTGG
ncbi:MAG TPA: TRAP transporter large permease subunit [Hyphomicrobiaceae bacterium]|nr:TRAP transporter large permease subunit [Hyphomicrobiaceae bacterium]